MANLIVGKQINLVAVGVTSSAAELNIMDGVTSTAAELNKLDGMSGTAVGTTDSQTMTNKTLTSPVMNTGVSGSAVKDEDDMSSDSATAVSTQQSIKAHVALHTAQLAVALG